jgi:hypothetical protein
MTTINPELLNFLLGALFMLTLVLLAVVIGAWRVVAWLWSKIAASTDVTARRQNGALSFSGNLVDVFGPPRAAKAAAPKKRRESSGSRSRASLNGVEGHA